MRGMCIEGGDGGVWGLQKGVWVMRLCRKGEDDYEDI